MIKVALFLLLSAMAIAHDHVPMDSDVRSFNGLVRLFKTYDQKYMVLWEFEGGRRYTQQSFTSLKLGTYRRLGKGKKVGVFILNKTGQRHSDDWVLNSENEWQWQDSSRRSEQEIHIDYTQRFRLGFSPPLVFSLSPKLSYNFFNNDVVLIITPTMSYFKLEQNKPKFSFHTKLPLYIPLNFEGETFYKYGFYQSALYHVSKRYIIGANFNFLVENWIESKEFQRELLVENYSGQDRTSVWRLDFIIKY